MIKAIGELEGELESLTDEELKARSLQLAERAQAAVKIWISCCQKLLLSAVKLAVAVSWACVTFDVQLIGAMTLHEGRIAEMRTGEGKTLMATLAVYLNALSGKGVHVVTVNDYLARRDADWMRPLYEFLGYELLGLLFPSKNPEEKRAAYQADITYGTNNEFGFDYLRDNMAFRKEDKFQRGTELCRCR